MVHPVQSVVESLYEAGRCPRLHVNALWDGVVCPDFIREQWRERLIIDLDANYPLDLSFGDDGIEADLSFGGFITRCSFPWGSIYVVADRATGHGFVLQQNVPASVKLNQPANKREDADDDDAGPRLAPVADAPGDSAEPLQPLTSPSASADGRPSEAKAAPVNGEDAPKDDGAARRRAAFRVIDGGG